MMTMSGKARTDVANRRNATVPAAALIGLLLTFLALPLCSAAFTCTMPCCEHSGAPTDDHDAMPGGVCGTECSVRAVAPPSVEVLASPAVAYVLPLQLPRVLADITASSSAGYSRVPYPRSSARPLYVINDAFLI